MKELFQSRLIINSALCVSLAIYHLIFNVHLSMSSSETNECDPNPACENTVGSYVCRCHDFF